jgi:mannan endo-1,6-alpha-mannosidase
MIAQKVAYKMMQFYPGNRTGGIPGLFGDVKPGMPYYWVRVLFQMGKGEM